MTVCADRLRGHRLQPQGPHLLASDLPQRRVTDGRVDVVVQGATVSLDRVGRTRVLAQPGLRVVAEPDIAELRVDEDLGPLVVVHLGGVVIRLALRDERALMPAAVVPVPHGPRLAGFFPLMTLVTIQLQALTLTFQTWKLSFRCPGWSQHCSSTSRRYPSA